MAKIDKKKNSRKIDNWKIFGAIIAFVILLVFLQLMQQENRNNSLENSVEQSPAIEIKSADEAVKETAKVKEEISNLKADLDKLVEGLK